MCSTASSSSAAITASSTRGVKEGAAASSLSVTSSAASCCTSLPAPSAVLRLPSSTSSSSSSCCDSSATVSCALLTELMTNAHSASSVALPSVLLSLEALLLPARLRKRVTFSGLVCSTSRSWRIRCTSAALAAASTAFGVSSPSSMSPTSLGGVWAASNCTSNSRALPPPAM